jgi:hypothetical protein
MLGGPSWVVATCRRCSGYGLGGLGGNPTRCRAARCSSMGRIGEESATIISNNGGLTAERSTHRATILMLVNASRTLLEVLEPTAMRGIIEDALRAPQASLTSELHRHAARTLETHAHEYPIFLVYKCVSKPHRRQPNGSLPLTHAHKMDAQEAYALEMHTREMHACEMHAL